MGRYVDQDGRIVKQCKGLTGVLWGAVRRYVAPPYLYFAQKADIEGYNDVAAVFTSTADGETGHAHGHLEFLEKVDGLVPSSPATFSMS